MEVRREEAFVSVEFRRCPSVVVGVLPLLLPTKAPEDEDDLLLLLRRGSYESSTCWRCCRPPEEEEEEDGALLPSFSSPGRFLRPELYPPVVSSSCEVVNLIPLAKEEESSS